MLALKQNKFGKKSKSGACRLEFLNASSEPLYHKILREEVSLLRKHVLNNVIGKENKTLQNLNEKYVKIIRDSGQYKNLFYLKQLVMRLMECFLSS